MARNIMAQKQDKVKKFDIAHSFDVWANKTIDDDRRDKVTRTMRMEVPVALAREREEFVYRVCCKSGQKEFVSGKILVPMSRIMYHGEKGIVVNRKEKGRWSAIW